MAGRVFMGVRIPSIPQLRDFRFPIGELNPHARENVVIGKKASPDKDFKENKNMAIAAIASAAIMLVAATVSSSLALPFLITAFSTSALVLAALGGVYFVTMRLLDPKEKNEHLKEQFRDAFLQRVLKKSNSELENYDLLERAIEDRTADPRAKEMVYLCLRQLRRNNHQLQQTREEHCQLVNRAFNNYFADAYDARRRIIGVIEHTRRATHHWKAAQRQGTERAYAQSLKNADKEKNIAMQRVDDAYNNAVNALEKRYQNLLNGCGPKHGFGRALEVGKKGAGVIGWGLARGWEMGKWAWDNC